MSLTSFNAGESISAGDVVFVNASGLLQKACGSSFDAGQAIGVALDTTTAGQLTRVNTDFIYAQASGMTPGQYRYLSPVTSGVHVDYDTWDTEAAGVSGPVYLTKIGQAATDTKLGVEVDPPFFFNNIRDFLLLESSTSPAEYILTEDGSIIQLETV